MNKAQFHNPQSQVSGHDRYHQSFTYDGLNRLTGADYGTGAEPTSTFFDVTGLNYDDAGNITGLQRKDETGSLIDDLSYSYQPGTNRLGSISDAVNTTTPDWDAESAGFGYDAAGNLTSQSGKIDHIAYDHRNLPTQFELTAGDTVIANYNASGQRILKESSGGAWSFYVKDGRQTLAVIDQNGFSHFNLVGNGTFGRWEPGGTRRYYITDHLGSTRAVVDNNGQVLEMFDYYPFGLLMPKRNTAGANTIEKYTGHELDEELGLYHGGARSLDPALGRWLGVDPLADEYPAWSSYNYAKNNPMFYVDPTGRNPVCGDQSNCDEIYQEGAIVENSRGHWQYLGNNEWKDLEYNQTQSAESLNMLFTSDLDRQENSKITQFDSNFFGKMEEEIDNSSVVTRTVLGGFYNSVDAIYMYGSLQRGRYKKSLSGKLVVGSELTDTMVDLLTTAVGKAPRFIPVKGNGLNASQFSSKFKGTPLARLKPATRGTVNRAYNKYYYKRQNSILVNSLLLNISLIGNNDQ